MNNKVGRKVEDPPNPIGPRGLPETLMVLVLVSNFPRKYFAKFQHSIFKISLKIDILSSNCVLSNKFKAEFVN